MFTVKVTLIELNYILSQLVEIQGTCKRSHFFFATGKVVVVAFLRELRRKTRD